MVLWEGSWQSRWGTEHEALVIAGRGDGGRSRRLCFVPADVLRESGERVD